MKGGDTILLASGTYDKLHIASGGKKSFDFSEKVTIASANPWNQAVVNEMFLARADNIEIRDLKFDYDGTIDGSTEILG